MSKENKWLIIFASIFLVIGIVGSLLISFYSNYSSEQKRLQNYKDLFPALVSVEEDKDFEKTDVVVKKENVYGKDKKLIGNAYTGTIVVKNTIPNVASAELTLLVGVDLKNKLTGVKTLVTEHTPDFYEAYDGIFENINKPTNNFEIDSVAGSTISGGIINEILTAIKVADLGIVLDEYEELFGEGVTAVVDEDFEAVVIEVGDNKIEVTIKETTKVYDEDDNLVGYTYKASSKTRSNEVPPNAELELLVGITTEGKIQGVIDTLNEHTGGFYNRYLNGFSSLEGSPVEDLEIDILTGATVSGDVIENIFKAIKEVILNG